MKIGQNRALDLKIRENFISLGTPVRFYRPQGPRIDPDPLETNKPGARDPLLNTAFLIYIFFLFFLFEIFPGGRRENSIAEKNGPPWGPPWVPMGPHGLPWVPMGPHGFPWVPMGSHGFPWVPMGSHGSPWVPMGPMGPLDPMGRKGPKGIPHNPRCERL